MPRRRERQRRRRRHRPSRAQTVLTGTRDYLNQIRRDLWRYAETDLNGALLEEATREMARRWTYRWELRHLLELCGFVVEAEYSDFTVRRPHMARN